MVEDLYLNLYELHFNSSLTMNHRQISTNATLLCKSACCICMPSKWFFFSISFFSLFMVFGGNNFIVDGKSRGLWLKRFYFLFQFI